ncbi:3-methyladenine DNA glycosylase, partial [Staphylococcus aureus]|nr:3-methyladenine DNA glycosylase [Staphylococcus aureus]
SIDTNNSKYTKDIIATTRIGIPNKGDWKHKSLRYTVKGNPFVYRMRKSDCMFPEDNWK